MRLFETGMSAVLRRSFRAALALTSLLLLAPSAFAQTKMPDYSKLNAAELQTLAEQGDTHAVFTQGYNLIFDGVTIRPNPDFETAKNLLETAHKNGHDTANSILMLYYEGEFGQAPDLEKLETLLTTSAERGSAVAKLNYAYRYIEADDVVKSDQALKYLLSAAENEIVRETAYPLLIEVLYGVNFDTKKDWPLAREKALACSKLWPESDFCHYILARDFENGWGGDTDVSKSDFHYLKAAEWGDARAQWKIGMYYLNGTRVEKNERTAYGWVKKSAEQDYLNGLISFAVMNALGQGTEINTATAFKTYETAASLGSAHAVRGLGSMYCAGEAPKTDKDLCAAGLILAYEMDDDLAGGLLGHFFDVEDQTGFDNLKKKTAPQRATLISRYNIQR